MVLLKASVQALSCWFDREITAGAKDAIISSTYHSSPNITS
jgi:hypothetical protein